MVSAQYEYNIIMIIMCDNYSTGYITDLLQKSSELCQNPDFEQTSTTLPGSLCSEYNHPDKTEAIKRHRSRFK